MLVLGVGLAYAVTMRRRRVGGRGAPDDNRRIVWFALGVALFWISTDWPIGALGAGYLASVHMAQYQLYTLVVAPLLLLGVSEDTARAIARRLGLSGMLPYLTRPVVAATVFNVVLLATHSPFVVDALRTSQVGSFVLDMIWLISGFVLWLPIVSPLPELRHPSPAVRCVYLFLAGAALAMIPGALITFAPFPLYRIYELAPRVNNISALDDQQIAGIVMKIGNLPVIWIVLCATFMRWAQRESSISYVTISPTGHDL